MTPEERARKAVEKFMTTRGRFELDEPGHLYCSDSNAGFEIDELLSGIGFFDAIREAELAAHSAALEEAAKVADEHPWQLHMEASSFEACAIHVKDEVASAIRNLKDKT